jgi:hypothetical protein
MKKVARSRITIERRNLKQPKTFEIVDFETTESMSKLLQKTINNSYDILN